MRERGMEREGVIKGVRERVREGRREGVEREGVREGRRDHQTHWTVLQVESGDVEGSCVRLFPVHRHHVTIVNREGVPYPVRKLMKGEYWSASGSRGRSFYPELEINSSYLFSSGWSCHKRDYCRSPTCFEYALCHDRVLHRLDKTE